MKYQDLLAKCTPGEWEVECDELSVGGPTRIVCTMSYCISGRDVARRAMADASIIAHEHNVMLPTIKKLEEIRAIAKSGCKCDGAGVESEMCSACLIFSEADSALYEIEEMGG